MCIFLPISGRSEYNAKKDDVIPNDRKGLQKKIFDVEIDLYDYGHFFAGLTSNEVGSASSSMFPAVLC